MRKITLLVIYLITFNYVKSQTVSPVVVSNDGGFVSAGGNSIAWTIGEPVSESYSSGGNITTLGFHQPEISLATFLSDNDEGMGIWVYPNPVHDLVKINFSNLPNATYELKVCDMLGRSLFTENIQINSNNSPVHSLNLNELAAANYLLIITGPSINKTIKLNLIH